MFVIRFVVFALLLPVVLSAEEPKASTEPASKPETKEQQKPAEAPRAETPGFWERAWKSTKKTASGAADAVAKPFGKLGSDPKDSAPEKALGQMEMTLAIDPTVVKLPETRSIQLKVALYNRTKKMLQMEFPTTQRIDVVLHGENGKVLYRMSDDQKFEEEAALVSVNPEERLEYTASVSTRDMQPGVSYLVEVFFPSQDTMRASRVIVPEK